MWITYITIGIVKCGYVCTPRKQSLMLSQWRTTECEWMVPGTHNPTED